MLRRGLVTLRRMVALTPQPTPWTHDKMQENDVLVGISKDALSNRRRGIIRQIIGSDDDASITPLSEMHGVSRTEHVVIVTSSSDVKMSNDVFYPFYQNTNFLYLTGFLEPDSILIIETIPGAPFPQHRSVLFVPEYDAKNEMVNGLRAGTTGALKLTGVNETYDINEFHKFIEKYEKIKIKIWGDLLPGKISNMDLHAKYLHDGLIKAAESGADIFAITPIIHQNRVIKRPEEIEAIRQCAQIACEGVA